MNATNIKKNVIKGLFWKFMERGGVQGVQFIIQIILARLLTPSDYGIIGLITVFIAIANVFVQSGFSSALVQKKEVDDLDLTSVFYLNLAIALMMCLFLVFTAPAIASFYQLELLIPVLRVLSITLFFGAFNCVQNAVLVREMNFKLTFYSSLGASIISGIIGIALAYLGYGVWSLVAQQFINGFMTTVILWFLVKWRPRLIFSFSRIQRLFKFGSKLLASGLLDTLFNNIYPLIIGKLFNQEMLGYYNRGQQIPALLVNNINGSIGGVLFPAFAASQDDRARLKQLVRRSIKTSCFIVFPMMAGLVAVAKPITIILLTDKWLPSVPFMQICCITYAMWPIHTANLQAINAVGRSDIFLKLEIIKKALVVIVLIISIPFGIYAMVWGTALSSILGTLINAFPNKKLLDYGFKEQIGDIIPSFLLSIGMGLITLSILFLNLNIWTTLTLQILIGTCLYLMGSYIFRIETLTYLLKTVKELLKQNRAVNNK